MKIGFLCPFGHLTIMDKPEHVQGRIPQQIICTSLACGCPAGLFEASILDDICVATHEFYEDKNGILTAEEQAYLNAGGILFREIPANIPESIKKEFTATKAINKLALYIINNLPKEDRLPDIIDTAIHILKKYKGHMEVMKSLSGKKLNNN